MKLFYRKYGNGPPLIILHGLFGSSDNWVTIAKNLGNIFTVYLPDQRNHGQSPHSDIHDYDSMREDLHELISDLKIKRFFLAGHSMGGKTAISFALKYPEMLNGLLIADISPFLNNNTEHRVYNQHLSIINAMINLDLSSISTRAEAESKLLLIIPEAKERGFVLKNLQRTNGNNFSWKINPSSLGTNLGKIMEGIDYKPLAGQQVTGFPIIFLKGGDSEYLPDNDFIEILKIFPGAELIKIADAGHWIHADQPGAVIRNIEKLLENS